MSLNVTLYQMAKKDNSTARPTASTTQQTYSCVLKDSCGVISPQIQLDLGTTGNPVSYNYAYIPDFGRYYWIDNWTYDRGLWTAALSVDVLATYKTQIGGTTQYVLRSATTFDGSIIDTYYPTKTGAHYTGNAIDNDPWGTPCIVLGIVGEGAGSTMGCVQYYAFTPAQAHSLFEYLLGSNQPGTGTGFDGLVWSALTLVDDAVKATFNPFQYITSAMWFPFTLTGISVSTIHLGKWQFSQTCTALDPQPYYSVPVGSIQIPKHTQASSRGTFLNNAPFMQYTLTYNPFGRIPLETNLMNGRSYVTTYLWVDGITGQARLTVGAANESGGAFVNEVLLGEYWAQLGVNVQIGQISNNLLAATYNFLPSVASIAGDPAALLNVGAALGDAVTNALPRVQSAGNNGCAMPYVLETPSLQAVWYDIADENVDHVGAPLCQEKQISTLGSGFVKCADGDFDINATKMEIGMIKEFLTGGFFYE